MNIVVVHEELQNVVWESLDHNDMGQEKAQSMADVHANGSREMPLGLDVAALNPQALSIGSVGQALMEHGSIWTSQVPKTVAFRHFGLGQRQLFCVRWMSRYRFVYPILFFPNLGRVGSFASPSTIFGQEALSGCWVHMCWVVPS